jgi:hypothetical protein
VQGIAVAARAVQQTNDSGRALDERANGRLLVPPDDEITFPGPGLGAVIGGERAIVD